MQTKELPERARLLSSRTGAAQDDSCDVQLWEVARLETHALCAWLVPKRDELVSGKYRVDEALGAGGMGAVLRATNIVSGRQVALKWLLPGSGHASVRFVREARAAARIDHPNVVDVYDVGEQNGSAFLVMELLQGETLTKALERGALKIPDIIKVLMAAIEGTAAAHREGVIHRDIKPDNIFLCRDASGALQTTKVLDFGISKISSIGGQVNPRLTKTGAVMGTPYYMSPEQIRGANEIDGRVDIYAFGVILYEALTGRVPFDGKTYSALVLEIATGTPERPSIVNPTLVGSLERVILKAMAREPSDRFASLEALAKALAPFAAGVGFQSGEPTRIEIERASGPATTPFVSESPPEVPVKRAPVLIAGAALALVIGLALWLSQPDAQEPAAAGIEHIATPAPTGSELSATPPKPEPPKPEPVVQAVVPDAGIAPTSARPDPVAPGGPLPTPGPAPAAPHEGGQGRRREHAQGQPSAPAAPTGSARSGTITADDF
jgi:serine/threonine protein kinase